VKSKRQLWYEAERRSAGLNAAFFELVNHPTNPLTNNDLQRLIERRPEVYGRFSSYVGKLPGRRAE